MFSVVLLPSSYLFNFMNVVYVGNFAQDVIQGDVFPDAEVNDQFLHMDVIMKILVKQEILLDCHAETGERVKQFLFKTVFKNQAEPLNFSRFRKMRGKPSRDHRDRQYDDDGGESDDVVVFASGTDQEP